MSVQRFKAALTTGTWKDNPEPLVSCDKGDFVKYEVFERLEHQHKKLQAHLAGYILTHEADSKHIQRLEDENAELRREFDRHE